MLLTHLVHLAAVFTAALGLEVQQRKPIEARGAALQDIVTWDQYSIFVRGERIVFLSGEFHPFRLPSPGLWLDVFQKIKALGFSGVSFYHNWALLEGEPGTFRADGIFQLQQFFDAASEAGIYLLARPGPYINSETSGGGYPGWVQRVKGELRTNSTSWIEATQNYINNIGALIRDAQITNGGPIILFQPENEYSICAGFTSIANINACLNAYYMADVEAMWRKVGIVLPFLTNDALSIGDWVPSSPVGGSDIYGFDSYPLGWGDSCTNPSNWDKGQTAVFPLSQYNYTTHLAQSADTPFAIVEYQGGTAEGWGGAGASSCAALLNNQFASVFNKIVFGFRVTILNFYMIFGGTNWGNIGHPLGYTTYDVGAAISENRQLSREKYSEYKLQGHFLKASPAYLTTTPQDGSFGVYTNTTDVVTTPLLGANGSFYIIRQTDWKASNTLTPYVLTIEASGSNVTIPQLGGALSLHGRDSKIHVADYDVGGINLIYSTAEVLTWAKTGTKTVLVLYGGEDETHEFSLSADLGCPTQIEGEGVTSREIGSSLVIQWDVHPVRRVVHFGNTLEVLLLWRNDAYNYWAVDLKYPEPVNNYVSPSRLGIAGSSVVVKAGYLLRNASVSGNAIYLIGDVNVTTVVEVIAAPVHCGARLFFNGEQLADAKCVQGRLTGTVTFRAPAVNLPDLASLDWHYIDTLPEIQSAYDDALWVAADHDTTNNAQVTIDPVSLSASDYGFHSGSLIYRGHFVANGAESSLNLTTSGGNAFSQSVWLGSTYLASWLGDPSVAAHNQTFEFSEKLDAGVSYVITVVIDHMGLSENTYIGADGAKEPRGILSYALSGHNDKSDIRWKVTGNLGGEKYVDKTRGPRNEGALFAERQGFHLPEAPVDLWESASPIDVGVSGVGIGFFGANFNLDLPTGFDIPLSIVVANTTTAGGSPALFRLQLFVNGWQFGKYVNTLGPQTNYPVPEGILNYHGSNYLAVSVWSLDPSGVKLGGLTLESTALVQSGYSKPEVVAGEVYTPRKGTY